MTVDAGVLKINELRQFMIEKLQGNPAAKEALGQSEAASVDGLRKMASYLSIAAIDDEELVQELDRGVQKIQTLIQFDDVNAKNVQQFFG